ncbi:MAG: hypothetical protein CL916_05750 [Deltaproteobacteria bacterium]|nr:hypothetical protein [Deltaproteobacteria bacterium]
MSSESIDSKPLDRGTVIASRYEIEKYLGESLLGPTYVVKHVEQETFLVLRFIRKEYKDKNDFEEVQGLIHKIRTIKHPNMIQYGNIGLYQETLFFTQEYFRSENLRALIINKQSEMIDFSIEEAFSIAAKILDAVEELHKVGIFHTTIKPENILVKDSALGERFVRRVKLNDVMTAAILGSDTPRNVYRPPECRPELAMNKDSSPASDIFSIGNILYELLVGKPAQGTYLPPSQIRSNLSSEVDDIINYALNFQPEDRYDSAKAMAEHIRQSVGEFVVSNPKGNNRIAIFALSAAVIVLSAFIGYLQMNEGVPSPQEQQFEQVQKEDALLLKEIKENFDPPDPMKVTEMNAKVGGMRYIPSGPVVIGVFQREYDYKLTKKRDTDVAADIVNVNHFYIDQFEYPNKLPMKGEKAEFLGNVTQEEAGKFCAKEGKRLCTATEWEKVCRGVKNYIYAFDDTYDEEYCNKENYEERCKNAYGVYGMSSDAAEWTSSISPTTTKEIVVKGGDVGGVPERRYRCSNVVSKSKILRNRLISFRCCKDVDAVLVEEERRAKEAEQEAENDTAEEEEEEEKD